MWVLCGSDEVALLPKRAAVWTAWSTWHTMAEQRRREVLAADWHAPRMITVCHKVFCPTVGFSSVFLELFRIYHCLRYTNAGTGTYRYMIPPAQTLIQMAHTGTLQMSHTLYQVPYKWLILSTSTNDIFIRST